MARLYFFLQLLFLHLRHDIISKTTHSRGRLGKRAPLLASHVTAGGSMAIKCFKSKQQRQINAPINTLITKILKSTDFFLGGGVYKTKANSRTVLSHTNVNSIIPSQSVCASSVNLLVPLVTFHAYRTLTSNASAALTPLPCSALTSTTSSRLPFSSPLFSPLPPTHAPPSLSLLVSSSSSSS